MKKLQANDPVIVITGKYKGKISTIESIAEDKVLVKGLNEVKKAVKGKGFITKHLPIHSSNIMYYDQEAKKPSRIGIVTDKNNKKSRISKVSKKEIK